MLIATYLLHSFRHFISQALTENEKLQFLELTSEIWGPCSYNHFSRIIQQVKKVQFPIKWRVFKLTILQQLVGLLLLGAARFFLPPTTLRSTTVQLEGCMCSNNMISGKARTCRTAASVWLEGTLINFKTLSLSACVTDIYYYNYEYIVVYMATWLHNKYCISIVWYWIINKYLTDIDPYEHRITDMACQWVHVILQPNGAQ